MAATTTDDYASCLAELEDAPEVTSIQPIGVDTITVEYAGAKESMQLYVIPRGASITDYVSLEELGGAAIDLEEAGAVITNNAATVLGLAEGDTARITTSALDEADVALTAITRNYLGNAVYLTEDAYEELFGPLELNGFFCHSRAPTMSRRPLPTRSTARSSGSPSQASPRCTSSLSRASRSSTWWSTWSSPWRRDSPS